MNDYDILGIKKNSTLPEIKKAYKNLLLKHHPDKGGNKDEFIKINVAYNNILRNESTNKYLNIFSELLNSDFVNNYINLFFNKFIYNHSYNNKKIYLKYNLEEVFNNCIKTIKYKQIIATSNTTFKFEEKILNININNTIFDNKRIIYKNFGDSVIYGNKNSDLIIIFKEEPHDIFKRNNNNLIVNIDLSLKEALIKNTTLAIPLLDNSIYYYKINKIINPNYQEIIKNYGIPTELGNGDLILKFNINFPDNLSDDNIEIIKNIL